MDFARRRDDIRAVVMNGSRVNPSAPRDRHQDYDVVFFVRNAEEEIYKADREWMETFGEVVMYQQNDFSQGSYIFLIQYFDGNRVDASFNDISSLNSHLTEDSLSYLLLDKDGLADSSPSPDESSYFTARPEEGEWDIGINELFWIPIYIDKEIERDEMEWAYGLYHEIFIPMLRKLISWHIGYRFDWNVNPGKSGKWFGRYLDEARFEIFRSLLNVDDYPRLRRNLTVALDLVGDIGRELAEQLGYEYPEKMEGNVRNYLGL